MPKKTHKQKIIAQYRRRINYLKQKQEVIEVKDDRKLETVSQTAEIIASQRSKNISYSAALTLVDLKKTLIISAFLFTLEILIFYAILKGIISGRV